MTEMDLAGWEDFERELAALRKKLCKSAGPLLFRGHADSTWRLETTLERAGKKQLKFSQYYQLTAAIRPAIETLTGVTWNIPDYGKEIEERLGEYDAFIHFFSSNVYRYMIYLRHHGFPSPLLDWSHSPYVAAFFAFRNPPTGATKASIYVFCETPEGFKGWSSNQPRIRRLGPYIRSHRRHFRQQSDYSICGSYDKTWRYHEHEKVFAIENPEQDALWKFNLPSTERVIVLRSLDLHNLNPFSLFDSEETLMETMWLREMILKQQEP